MNPSGKSYVCILHEYVQHALKKQPTYKFKELGEFFVFNVASGSWRHFSRLILCKITLEKRSCHIFMTMNSLFEKKKKPDYLSVSVGVKAHPCFPIKLITFIYLFRECCNALFRGSLYQRHGIREWIRKQ